MKTNTDLAQVVKTFGKSFIKNTLLSPQQTKVLHNIVTCGTATLGGHKEVCNNCGQIKYHYNSCGDRHCPKCQYSKQIKWIDKLQIQAFPVKHYHIIFTVPHSLNKVCLWNDKLYYSILFKSVWETLRSFGYTKYWSSKWCYCSTAYLGTKFDFASSRALYCTIGWCRFKRSLETYWKKR
ncbi:MAG TPA: hypothetical protein EYG92_06910 [Lutibacter sp.]|nr:hypothetical protein [Lutibacter sp.]